jgi:hypothetical protein
MTDKYQEKAREIVTNWDHADMEHLDWFKKLNLLSLMVARALRAANDEKCEKCKQEKSVITWPSEDECLKNRKLIAAPAMRDMISRGQAIQMMFDYECWLRSKVEGKDDGNETV